MTTGVNLSEQARKNNIITLKGELLTANYSIAATLTLSYVVLPAYRFMARKCQLSAQGYDRASHRPKSPPAHLSPPVRRILPEPKPNARR